MHLKQTHLSTTRRNTDYMKEWITEWSQLFALPKNLESGKGPPFSSLSLLECLRLFDLCFLSLFVLFDLDFDLLDSLSSSLLEDSDDELEELDSEDFLRECCANTSSHTKITISPEKNHIYKPLISASLRSFFLVFPNLTTLWFCKLKIADTISNLWIDGGI